MCFEAYQKQTVGSTIKARQLMDMNAQVFMAPARDDRGVGEPAVGNELRAHPRSGGLQVQPITFMQQIIAQILIFTFTTTSTSTAASALTSTYTSTPTTLTVTTTVSTTPTVHNHLDIDRHVNSNLHKHTLTSTTQCSIIIIDVAVMYL